MITYTPAEVEEARQEFLSRADADDVCPGPGTFTYHEALDRAFVRMVDSHSVMEHPSVLADPEAFAFAHAAHVALFNLYQHLGGKHIPGDNNDTPG